MATGTTGIIPGKCEIAKVNVNPLYERTQIVNRGKSHEITFYMYHQWAVRPADAIRVMVGDYMQNKKLFESVSSRYSRTIPDYRLETSVKDLELVEMNNSFSAHVNLEFELVLNINDSVMVKHKADRTEPLERKNMNLFASKVSIIFFEELEALADLINKKDLIDESER